MYPFNWLAVGSALVKMGGTCLAIGLPSGIVSRILDLKLAVPTAFNCATNKREEMILIGAGTEPDLSLEGTRCKRADQGLEIVLHHRRRAAEELYALPAIIVDMVASNKPVPARLKEQQTIRFACLVEEEQRGHHKK